MEVSIDQSGGKKETVQIEDLAAVGVFFTHPGNPFPHYGDIGKIDLCRKDVDNPSASQQKVSRPVPFGNFNQIFHKKFSPQSPQSKMHELQRFQ
jgi:hypothetical protein